MKILNNFQNALFSDFKLCAHLRNGISYLHAIKSKQSKSKYSFILFFMASFHSQAQCHIVGLFTKPLTCTLENFTGETKNFLDCLLFAIFL